MKLKKLLKDLPIEEVKGSKEVEITGICANSKLVAPGNLFVAKKGGKADGAYYIPEAIANGAVAVLTDIYDPSLKHVSQVIHPHVPMVEGLLSSQYYSFPSQSLFVVGITGTNGKTTTAYLVKSLLEALDGPCGLIGTIEYLMGTHRYQATRTTPEVALNHKMLKEMVQQGCKSAIMEVTSHALDQGRVQNIEYDVAVFTNLSLDHLDYHETMEKYCDAKRKLFLSMSTKSKKKHSFPKVAVVNADDPWHSRLIEGCQVEILNYAIDSDADLKASDICLTPSGTQLNVHYQDKTIACSWPLIGRFNVYNCLAAMGVALSRGFSLEDIRQALKALPGVPGRLQLVPNPLNLKIYVDFAHSDDALENVLQCLRELKPKRMITVFGCGGDRDVTKRPKMAQVCEGLSDLSIVTTDNPRTEDPQAIIRDIIQGFQNQDCYVVEPDRRRAIERAIELADPEDIILIAGKGHERFQIYEHQTVEFDDSQVAVEICKAKRKRQ